jgi:hypothetical protein
MDLPRPGWEPVYTVNDYFNRPRLGVAEYLGEPHIYESVFDASRDCYSDHYFASPIGRDLLRLVQQDWEIWQRWQAAYSAGAVTLDSHPALPEDKEAHEQLHCEIGDRLKADRDQAKKLWARFRESASAAGGLEVKWFDSENRFRSSA